MKEGIQELTLSTPFTQLEILCELLVDFKNIKVNGFDLIDWVKTQNWEGFFDRLKHVYLELVKQLCIFASIINLQITLFVLGHKITISKKSITKLLNHDSSRKRCFKMPSKKTRLDDIAEVIFQDGKNSSNAKYLHNHLRVWFKILLGCIYHMPLTNYSDYINTDHKHVLYYLLSGVKWKCDKHKKGGIWIGF